MATISTINMAQNSPVGPSATYMAVNQGPAKPQLHQLSPAQRMASQTTETVLYGSKMTGLGSILDLDT